jgi:hypothetical protein
VYAFTQSFEAKKGVILKHIRYRSVDTVRLNTGKALLLVKLLVKGNKLKIFNSVKLTSIKEFVIDRNCSKGHITLYINLS